MLCSARGLGDIIALRDSQVTLVSVFGQGLSLAPPADLRNAEFALRSVGDLPGRTQKPGTGNQKVTVTWQHLAMAELTGLSG